MPFVITWSTGRDSFQEKWTRKNKTLLTWKERRKEKRKGKTLKQKDTAGKSRNEKKKKTNDKMGIYFNYTNSVKLTAHYETYYSIWNVFHTSIKKK